MDENLDLYCAIYVHAPVTREQLVAVVLQIPGAEKVGRSILRLLKAEIEVRPNEDASDGLRGNLENGFLFYPYLLEVDALPEQTIEEQIALVSALLELLWAQQFNAVAACDFEDRLPRSGRDAWGAS